ncbi:hypothetical protein [Rhizobium leguminosarum]|uniref:hypothetical protein n=1 Tax=Rhizobium leguminosarum TaxID=384 RepID=UPI0014414BB2|nr:hypothetical protein [Rhizobium leguminosarum]NKM97658.1 hypothetical protein [Rhizobium leguminosarum bv. viciae]
MEINDLPYEKLKLLLKEDHQAISLNLRVAALFLVVYENLKDLITDKARSFFTDDWQIVDGKLEGKPSQKYLDLLRGKSAFRACRDFHIEIGAISSEDDELIDRFSAYRGEVAHELYSILFDDSKAALDVDLLFQVHRLARNIDRWWILNVEIATDGDWVDKEIDEEQVMSGRQLFLDQLVRVALKDVLDLLEEEGA